jgi:hypothetical protein
MRQAVFVEAEVTELSDCTCVVSQAAVVFGGGSLRPSADLFRERHFRSQ